MSKKTYDAELKAKIVLEVLKGEKTAAQLCREHNIAQDLLSRWRTDFIERVPELFKTPRQQSAEEARIAELERLVGQLTLELSAAKKVSSLLRSRSRSGGSS
jgi:transposase-like protein